MLKVTLKDLVTGEVKVYPDTDIPAFAWIDGNWSCDCNRCIAFTEECLPFDEPCTEDRYIVIDVEGDEIGLDGYTKEEIIIEANRYYQPH